MRARFVLPAVGATLVTMGLFAPPGAHAQEAPPSNPPDLGLPPATARPAKGEAPAVTARPAGVSFGAGSLWVTNKGDGTV